MKIRSIGQSGFVITSRDGTVVMTDPWLAPSLLKNYRTPVNHRKIERCDVVLASHAHIDHVDAAALRMAGRLNSTLVGSSRAARKARRAGLENTVKMKAGDTGRIAGLKIHAVPASHPLAADAVGFVVEGDKTVYFSGDTRYNEGLIDALKRFDIDIALLQIACSVYFFKKDGMDICDAAELARRIKPKVAIPMHYHDIFRRPDPERFRKRLSGAGININILKPGEERKY